MALWAATAFTLSFWTTCLHNRQPSHWLKRLTRRKAFVSELWGPASGLFESNLKIWKNEK